jgi:coenzyme F420-reducing hydrogenase delta subunit/Pyruvate/2-oxoacid:ferredoxin oxidoreductase delta subunit
VALAVGLEREAGPRDLRCALETGQRLIGELGGTATLFTGNLKVAAPDLEAMSQGARNGGMLLVKFAEGRPEISLGDSSLEVLWNDEVLERQVTQEFDLLAIDQRPARDPAHRELARALRLGEPKDGDLQPDRINTLPAYSPRGGLFLVGEAAGARDLEPALDQTADALWQVGRLLGRGEVSAPKGQVIVDRKRCALCLTCVRVCPHGAMDRTERRPFANPLVCQTCGTCAAECPMDAIQLLGFEDERYSRQVKAAVTPVSTLSPQDPPLEMLVLACSNSAGQALAAARLAGGPWPKGARLVRVPCAGKIDPAMVLDAFREGMDGVLVLTCHPHACYSLEGNTWAGFRIDYLRQLLSEAGMEPGRLLSESGAAAMGSQVLDQVNQALEAITRLGPSPLKMGARVRDIMAHFSVGMDENYTIIP